MNANERAELRKIVEAMTPGEWFYQDGNGGEFFPSVVLGGDDPNSEHSICINSCGGENGGYMPELGNDLLDSPSEIIPGILRKVVDSPANTGIVR